MSTDLPPPLNPSASNREAERNYRFLHPIILSLVAGCLFFVALGRLPLLEPDEGRNSEVAREMLAGGDWLVPHYDGFPYLDKPPALFCLVAGSFKLFGISEWAARVPSALSALGTVFLVWLLGCLMFGESVGLMAGVIFAAAPLTIIFSRLVIFDMLLTFLMTLAMVCFWLGERSGGGRLRFDLLLFAAMGAATITKGPVGFLIPLLAIGVYLGLRGRLRNLKAIHWGLGLAVFCAIVLSWFVTVSIRHPDFPKYALWEESLERFATSHAHRSGGVFYYVPVYLVGFLPWSFFLLYAGFGRLGKWRELRNSAPVLFLTAWAAVIFVFFSISNSKLPGYFLPAIVPLSVLMAKVWKEAESGLRSRIPDWLTAGFATLIVLGLLALMAPELLHFPSIHARITKKLPMDVAALLGPSITYSGLILIALGMVGRDLLVRFKKKASGWAAFGLLALTFPLLLLRWSGPLKRYVEEDSSRALARTILASPERDLPVYGYYYFRTSLPFYLRQPVGLVTSDADELTSNYVVSRWPQIRSVVTPSLFPGAAGSQVRWFEGNPPLMREKDWLAESPSSPVLVILRNDRVSLLAESARRMEPLWSGWRYSVWKVWRAKH